MAPHGQGSGSNIWAPTMAKARQRPWNVDAGGATRECLLRAAAPDGYSRMVPCSAADMMGKVTDASAAVSGGVSSN